jgi:hypothetical protein
MDIDHTELKHAARAFANESQDLSDTVNGLLRMIDDLGNVYGDDDPGSQAKQGFTHAREELVGYSGALCAAYGKVGANLGLMSDDVDVADWSIIASLPPVDMTTIPRLGP